VPYASIRHALNRAFSLLDADSGSAYRGSNPWGAAKSNQSLISRLRPHGSTFESGDVFAAIANLESQGRVHEIVGHDDRLNEIAREYAREPQGALVISPDNESRHQLNTLIHREMQERGDVSQDEHKLRVLNSPRR
jgi:hypothetical protein